MLNRTTIKTFLCFWKTNSYAYQGVNLITVLLLDMFTFKIIVSYINIV